MSASTAGSTIATGGPTAEQVKDHVECPDGFTEAVSRFLRALERR